jgi:predicted NBD/HSP70 family sugar kinase
MPPVARRRLVDQIELNDHEKKNLTILDTIRKRGPIARAEISRLIGLNIVTVTSYVDQYIKKGVIKEVGIDVSSGGRKPTLVDLNPSAIFTIGVGLSVSHMTSVLCNLKGDIVHSEQMERPMKSGEEFVMAMVSLVSELIKKSNVDTGKVHGIGIGIPGPINLDTNSVRWEAGLAGGDLWITVSIHGIFEDKFGIPTLVDHDANMAMFGEDWYGSRLGLRHAIYLYAGDGFGFFINGQVYRGANGCAGEWLFNTPDDTLPKELQPYAKDRMWWTLDLGISLRAEAFQNDHANSKIYELVKGDAKKINVSVVAKAAEAGDPLAITLLKEGGNRLGRKAAFLVNLINPEILIVGGGTEAAGTYFMDALRDTVKQLSIPEATDKLRVIPSQLGENGVALGAAALVAQNYFVSV